MVLVVLGMGVPATTEAALRKYRLHTIDITESPDSSPRAMKTGADDPPAAPFDTVLIDDPGTGSPQLRKFRFKSLWSTTVALPCLPTPQCGFIFLRFNEIEGPGPVAKPAAFTGTGSTAAGSKLAWGVVTGWTITGSRFCRSAPTVICEYAGVSHDTTLDPLFYSDLYDLGTWTFHPTGFTAVPFVHRYFTPEGNFGNNQRWVRGFQVLDATVPALPLLGTLLLGGSLALGAFTMLRRRGGGR